jgi:hypothetical protein
VWWQGLFSIRIGTLLKQQLLAGILKLTPDEIRLDGIGQHFGADLDDEEARVIGTALLRVARAREPSAGRRPPRG